MLLQVTDEGSLTLGACPFRIISGSFHYCRVPRALWRDRLLKLLDLGCNCVETYIFWNLHEPEEGKFVFRTDETRVCTHNQNIPDFEFDPIAFIQLAHELGLKVIVRPGPYVCAEWDMGGLPSWLIKKNPRMSVRSMDPDYISAVENYFDVLLPQLHPLQSTLGGPIIAIQIENEYGDSGNDQKYLKYLHDLYSEKHKFDVLLFTDDGAFRKIALLHGHLPSVLHCSNFGSTASERFQLMQQTVNSKQPSICMEFWVGWFDDWKKEHHSRRSAVEVAEELDKLLSLGNSHVNFYMFIGGTNFGFTAGGNLSKKNGKESFLPFVTSYDYDALLTECGDCTEKYYTCRQVIYKHLSRDLSRASQWHPSVKKAYGKVSPLERIPLAAVLRSEGIEKIESVGVKTFEELECSGGFVIYRTKISRACSGETLHLPGMHDWCQIFLDGRSLGCFYRGDTVNGEVSASLGDITGEYGELEILLHVLARSNYGKWITEPKGLSQTPWVGTNEANGSNLYHWTHHLLPLNCVPDVSVTGESEREQFRVGFLKFEVLVDEVGDTFVRSEGLELGCIFVNGINLGRYWNSAGPQETLYVPRCYIHEGKNEIIVFEGAQICQEKCELEFVDFPILDKSL